MPFRRCYSILRLAQLLWAGSSRKDNVRNSKSGCTIGSRNTTASWPLLDLVLVGLLRLRHMARES